MFYQLLTITGLAVLSESALFRLRQDWLELCFRGLCYRPDQWLHPDYHSSARTAYCLERTAAVSSLGSEICPSLFCARTAEASDRPMLAALNAPSMHPTDLGYTMTLVDKFIGEGWMFLESRTDGFFVTYGLPSEKVVFAKETLIQLGGTICTETSTSYTVFSSCEKVRYTSTNTTSVVTLVETFTTTTTSLLQVTQVNTAIMTTTLTDYKISTKTLTLAVPTLSGSAVSCNTPHPTLVLEPSLSDPCVSSDNCPACLPAHRVCDGRLDCDNGLDEYVC
uniref:Uncharacterized protein n=1 Tax=Whenzhou Shrimp Virus 2 TaxID=1608096 RepID=A0A1B2CVN6_9VIRU|nr:hypothetical protein [Whenzhou Shrimp Virus 2]